MTRVAMEKAFLFRDCTTMVSDYGVTVDYEQSSEIYRILITQPNRAVN